MSAREGWFACCSKQAAKSACSHVHSEKSMLSSNELAATLSYEAMQVVWATLIPYCFDVIMLLLMLRCLAGLTSKQLLTVM